MESNERYRVEGLVVGRRRDGKRRYSESGKHRQLIKDCADSPGHLKAARSQRSASSPAAAGGGRRPRRQNSDDPSSRSRRALPETLPRETLEHSPGADCPGLAGAVAATDRRGRLRATGGCACVVAAAMDVARCHADAAERPHAPGVRGPDDSARQGLEYGERHRHRIARVQVHGGMGFIEVTGAAQHLRDVRITTIYEGTTGIQAADLIGRKIARDGATRSAR